MYVEDVKNGKRAYTHIFAHNFLNIQLIFNPEKVLESWDLELFNHTITYCVHLSMSKMSKIDQVHLMKGFNAMYAMYVKDVKDSKRNKRKHWLYLSKTSEMYIAYIAQ